MGLFDNMYGFNPNAIQTLTFPQQRMMSTPQSVTPIQQPGIELPRVNGRDGAMRFPLQPNSRIALFDADEDIMYIKQTDAGGYPIVTAYTFAPLESTQIINAEYVTMDEFNRFKEEMLNGKQLIREPEASKSSNERNRQSKKHDANV